MDFEYFLRMAEKDFTVEKTETGTYLVSRDGKVAEVEPHKNCCYDNFLRFFEAVPRDSDVGHDDLHPRTQIGERVSGSRVGPEHPLFGRRPVYRGEGLQFPKFARFDPMGPSRDRDRSKDFNPNPDSLDPRGFDPDKGPF